MKKSKKICIFLMAIIFLVGLFSFIQSGSKPNNVLALTSTDIFGPECKNGQIIGDINNDGKITKDDSLIAGKIDTGTLSAPADICCADADQDGKLTTFDALRIDEIVAGTSISPGKCAGNNTSASAVPCTDSDGGKDYNKNGTITGYDSYGGNISNIKTYTDKCDGARVMEFYCETQNDPHSGAGYVAMESYLCPNGCQDGTCISKTSSKPDLMIKDVYFSPLNPKEGEIFTGELKINLANIGNAATNSKEGIRINSAIRKADGSLLGWSGLDSLKYVDNLSANGNEIASLPLQAVNFNTSSITVNVWLDQSENSAGLIEESNENNNTLTKTIIIKSSVADLDNIANHVLDDKLEKINNTAKNLNENKFDQILTELKILKDTVKEQQAEIKYLRSLKQDVKKLSVAVESAINNFITYGVDENTKKLGAGERAAVMYSYKAAFAKLPETEEELADAIKIANGRWPSVTNEDAEKKSKEQFQKIYKRIPDMNNTKDNAAVTVMAYGLRQRAENRNLNSEKTGINIFKGIYNKLPETTEEWNMMQAITYSGAAREKDTDGDLLPDWREEELGTDKMKKDTDGDGYADGAEVLSGYDPLKK